MIFSALLVVALAGASVGFAPQNRPTRSRSSTTELFRTKAPVFGEVCDTTGVTLKRFMSEVALLNPEITELTTLFCGIETACKALANLVKRSQLPSSETLGYEGAINVQGEDQKVRIVDEARTLQDIGVVNMHHCV